MFGLLIDSEIEGFLTYRTFARALMRFAMRILDSGPVTVSQDTEAQFVEILFAISAKIRLEPEILPIWFSGNIRTDVEENGHKEQKSFVGVTQKDDFPLCYMFIDRVHHEGRIGDFARTGLLYIFEAASKSDQLEAWLVASDLPTLMASGLGALYSQLSRELSLCQDVNRLPLLLAFSDYAETHRDSGAENIFSERHATDLSTFLSDLTFWQDILEHCESEDVRQTLLDHFQILFLQQLLYPSLLQSSDTDGGSSVAVLTYLTSMLETLSHPGLVRMILNYLLAVQEQKDPSRPQSPSVIRRKSFLVELTAPQLEEDAVEPVLFNLVDLIQTGISSQNPQTTFAALKLYAVIATQHQSYALGSLVKATKDHKLQIERTVGALQCEVEDLLKLAAKIGGANRLEENFANACLDVQCALELQEYQAVNLPTVLQLDNSNMLEKSQHNKTQYLLDQRDPCFAAMIVSVRDFLTNSVDLNLGLTEALLGLAVCREIQLDDWLALSPTHYRYDLPTSEDDEALNLTIQMAAMDDEEREAYVAAKKACQRPTWDKFSESKLMASLRLLDDQVSFLRKTYANFDRMLHKRKTILLRPAESEEDIPPSPKIGHNSPAASSRKLSRVRQGSIASSGTGSPTRPVNTTRDRPGSAGSPQKQHSPSSSTASRSRRVNSSPRKASSIFRPPPPESPNTSSPRGSIIGETVSKPDNEAAVLQQKVRFPLGQVPGLDATGEEAALSVGDRGEEATLSHVLTNVVILQNFILELVAVMQLRASLFEEVRFA